MGVNNSMSYVQKFVIEALIYKFGMRDACMTGIVAFIPCLKECERANDILFWTNPKI